MIALPHLFDLIWCELPEYQKFFYCLLLVSINLWCLKALIVSLGKKAAAKKHMKKEALSGFLVLLSVFINTLYMYLWELFEMWKNSYGNYLKCERTHMSTAFIIAKSTLNICGIHLCVDSFKLLNADETHITSYIIIHISVLRLGAVCVPFDWVGNNDVHVHVIIIKKIYHLPKCIPCHFLSDE